MSDSVKFGFPRLEDPAERLDRIENVLPICVRISEYRESVKRVDVISSNLESLSSDSMRLAQDLKSLKDSLSKNTQEHVDKLGHRDKEHSHLKSQVNQLSPRLIAFSHDLEGLTLEVAEMKKNVSFILERARVESLPEKLTSLLVQVQNQQSQIDLMMRSFASLSQMHEKVDRNVQELGVISAKHTESSNDHWDRMDKLHKDLDYHRSSNAESMSQMTAKMESFKKALMELIDQKIANIQFPEAGPGGEDIKKWIANALESVMMDSKIAIARTNNNEMKVNLLDKKIEQLSLVVKRFELSQ
jgi:hypothetical protein